MEDMEALMGIICFFALLVVACVVAILFKETDSVMFRTNLALALLFQPIVRISLGRKVWQFVDIVVAGLLFYLLWKDRPKQA